MITHIKTLIISAYFSSHIINPGDPVVLVFQVEPSSWENCSHHEKKVHEDVTPAVNHGPNCRCQQNH